MSGRVAVMWWSVRLSLLFAVCLTGTKMFSTAVDSNLNSPIWQVRRDAFERLAGSPMVLSDHVLQRELVHLRNVENLQAETSSSDLGEDEDYLAYSDQLTEIIKKIAVATNSPSAWRSLVYAPYNSQSEMGIWLANQRPAFPFIVEQTRSKISAERMVSVYLLAMVLRRSKSDHSLSPAQYHALKRKIRYLVKNDIPPVRQSAIQGLGIIGDSEDAPLLETLDSAQINPVTRKFSEEALAKIRKGKTP